MRENFCLDQGWKQTHMKKYAKFALLNGTVLELLEVKKPN